MRKKITALILALSMVFCLSACGEEQAEEETGAIGVAVQVQSAAVQSISTDMTVSGKVAAEAETAVYVLGSNNAKCVAVYVSEGDYVSAGTVLCTLDTSNTSGNDISEQASYLSSMENYNAQKELLDRQVALMEKTYNDTLALFEIGAASQMEVDSAELQYLSAKAQRDMTLAQLAAGMSNYQSNYMQADMAMQGIDANGNVVAPISGRITSLSAAVGGAVSSAQPIAVIDSTGRMRINVSVSEALVPKLTVGDMASVTISSLDLAFDAPIYSIDRSANMQTQLYGVVLSVPEEFEGLRSGIFADVSFHTDVSAEAVVVPTEAILTSNNEQYVYVVDGNAAKKTVVSTGLTGSGITEITSGVAAGDSVVTVGQQYLSDGEAVRVVEGVK